MAKDINVKLKLKNQFSKPLQAATKSTEAVNRHLKRATRSVKKFGLATKNAMKKTAKYAAVGAGAVGASMAVYAKNSIEAAKVQIEQETKLQAVLMNTKGMRLEQIEGLKKYAGELQQVGVVGDEVAIAGMQQLGSYKLQASSIKTLLPGMEDLLVQTKGLNGTTGDFVNIGNMVGKVMTGQLGALSRAGIEFDDAQGKILKFGTEQQKAATLAEVLRENVGGVNKAMAATDAGRIKNMANNWGDVSEEVGKMLLPTLARLSGWFNNYIPKIQEAMLGAIDKIGEAFTQIKPYVLEAKKLLGRVAEDAMPAIEAFKKVAVDSMKAVGGVITTLVKNWDRLSPIIYTVVGAMTAYNVVTKGWALYTTAAATASKLKASWDAFGAGKLTVLTAAQWAYNVALNANPIGLVIGAMAALVGVGVMLYKNWDLVTLKCKELWGWVRGLWESLDNNPLGRVAKAFITMFNPISHVIKMFGFLKKTVLAVAGAGKKLYQNWDVIKEKCSNLVAGVKGLWDSLDNNPVGKVVKAFIKWTNPIHNIIVTFKLLKDAVVGVYDFLSDKFSSLLESMANPLESAKNAVGGVIDSLKFWESDEPKDKNLKVTTTKETKDIGGSKPPRHALGTSYFQGGATRINEGGRSETAVLPAGTKILSHEEGKRQDKKSNGNINVKVIIQGNVIGNKQFMEQCGEYTGRKVLAALANM